MNQKDCHESEKQTPIKLTEASELLATRMSQDTDIQEMKKSTPEMLAMQLSSRCSIDSIAACPNNFPTMTSEEMEASLSPNRKNAANQPQNKLMNNCTTTEKSGPFNLVKVSPLALDSSFSDSDENSQTKRRNSANEISFLFEDEGSPLKEKQTVSPNLPTSDPATMTSNFEAMKRSQSPKLPQLALSPRTSPVQLANLVQVKKEEPAEEKPSGMRRVKRFLNLEQKSGHLSSSRGTSPDCLSSSQASDAFGFLKDTAFAKNR